MDIALFGDSIGTLIGALFRDAHHHSLYVESAAGGGLTACQTALPFLANYVYIAPA